MAQQFQTFEDFNNYMRNKAVEDEEFRARLLADPRAVIEEELYLSIPDGIDIQVHEDTATTSHFVIPPSAKLAEEDMHAVAGGKTGGWCSPNDL
ncbi:MAG: NHLP leader peptide family RiPP precursor [Acidobacteria bacterium]|nr:NHLP leader peptide family RiPP precursor [Acidobacteriota bacterium]